MRHGAIALILALAACGRAESPPPSTARLKVTPEMKAKWWLPVSGEKAEEKEEPKPPPPPKKPEPVVEKPKPPAEKPAERPVEKPSGGPAPGTAIVRGVVHFEGRRPKPRKIRFSPECSALHAGPVFGDTLVVSEDGRVAWTFVHVTGGLEKRKFSVPSAKAVVDQNGCVYVPHVVGMMAGQTLTIKSSDELLHNVHALGFDNPEFNKGMPGKGAFDVTLAKPEMLKIKCDVHPWMGAWVCIVDNPFHGVSNEKGEFEIRGLPPGTYTLETWHEELKPASASVTVEAGEVKTVDFTLKDKK